MWSWEQSSLQAHILASAETGDPKLFGEKPAAVAQSPRKGCGQLVLICYPAELPTWAQASSCICEFEDHEIIAITKGQNFIC